MPLEMNASKDETTTLPEPPDAVFGAALGALQHAKRTTILAAHNGGRRVVAREKGKFSNPKLYELRVEPDATGSRLHVVVGTDPRSPKAVLDGKFNTKALKELVEQVRATLAGGAPAASPVGDFFLQKKTEVPWTDPEEEPEIELDGNLLAMYGR